MQDKQFKKILNSGMASWHQTILPDGFYVGVKH